MEILLIVLACAAIVLLGYLAQYLLNKIKGGKSIFSKELPTSFKIVFASLLIIGAMGLVILCSIKCPDMLNFLGFLAPLLAITIIGIFSKGGLSLIGINGGEPKTKKEKPPMDEKSAKYFRQRNIVLIIIFSLILIGIIQDILAQL